MLPCLLEAIRKDEFDRLAIVSLGFIATERDSEAVEVLRSVAYPQDRPVHTGALEALLRIGGSCAGGVLERLERGELGHPESGFLMDRLWTLRRIEDLERAQAALERVSRTHPQDSVRVHARESGLPRVEAVLGIRRRPGAPETVATLTAILRRRDPAFRSLAGSTAKLWALQRLKALNRPGEIVAAFPGKLATRRK